MPMMDPLPHAPSLLPRRTPWRDPASSPGRLSLPSFPAHATTPSESQGYVSPATPPSQLPAADSSPGINHERSFRIQQNDNYGVKNKDIRDAAYGKFGRARQAEVGRPGRGGDGEEVGLTRGIPPPATPLLQISQGAYDTPGRHPRYETPGRPYDTPVPRYQTTIGQARFDAPADGPEYVSPREVDPYFNPVLRITSKLPPGQLQSSGQGGGGKKGQGKKTDGKQPTFLTKLYAILEQPEYHHLLLSYTMSDQSLSIRLTSGGARLLSLSGMWTDGADPYEGIMRIAETLSACISSDTILYPSGITSFACADHTSVSIVHEIIRWDKDESTIIIEKPEELADKILPLVYKQSRFASFSRQLNIYGWMRKVSLRHVEKGINDPDASTWSVRYQRSIPLRPSRLCSLSYQELEVLLLTSAHPFLRRTSTQAEILGFKRRVPPRPSQAKKRQQSSPQNEDLSSDSDDYTSPPDAYHHHLMSDLEPPRRRNGRLSSSSPPLIRPGSINNNRNPLPRYSVQGKIDQEVEVETPVQRADSPLDEFNIAYKRITSGRALPVPLGVGTPAIFHTLLPFHQSDPYQHNQTSSQQSEIQPSSAPVSGGFLHNPTVRQMHLRTRSVQAEPSSATLYSPSSSSISLSPSFPQVEDVQEQKNKPYDLTHPSTWTRTGFTDFGGHTYTPLNNRGNLHITLPPTQVHLPSTVSPGVYQTGFVLPPQKPSYVPFTPRAMPEGAVSPITLNHSPNRSIEESPVISPNVSTRQMEMELDVELDTAYKSQSPRLSQSRSNLNQEENPQLPDYQPQTPRQTYIAQSPQLSYTNQSPQMPYPVQSPQMSYPNQSPQSILQGSPTLAQAYDIPMDTPVPLPRRASYGAPPPGGSMGSGQRLAMSSLTNSLSSRVGRQKENVSGHLERNSESQRMGAAYGETGMDQGGVGKEQGSARIGQDNTEKGGENIGDGGREEGMTRGKEKSPRIIHARRATLASPYSTIKRPGVYSTQSEVDVRRKPDIVWGAAQSLPGQLQRQLGQDDSLQMRHNEDLVDQTYSDQFGEDQRRHHSQGQIGQGVQDQFRSPIIKDSNHSHSISPQLNPPSFSIPSKPSTPHRTERTFWSVDRPSSQANHRLWKPPVSDQPNEEWKTSQDQTEQWTRDNHRQNPQEMIVRDGEVDKEEERERLDQRWSTRQSPGLPSADLEGLGHPFEGMFEDEAMSMTAGP
ncbi:hypothetical protein TREMEDRAFT_65586 [Tremella mesenterica DSM 1558]|uniref:uncharacterized protein n=1 Tax=Tremella mesenterica (strain ATCC 24925 / CBS 8224 / DSM 1558 / NBRC 9311 / NRRL Y-6157 / RJB 2259-6 / UBC 559-6) TaxID=578456 RepID=UPI00032C1F6C|nr:uncharacterized protein TREMEDRAFT_65586 [Tremella mesenterica DSM 1558]EIW66315.1 hypothetical protein TREMEDRAFT_65586 [Tremella mesenterica DSM 1558]